MEKLQKEENLEDELEQLRDYGFNIDDLMDMLNEHDEKDDDEE